MKKDLYNLYIILLTWERKSCKVVKESFQNGILKEYMIKGFAMDDDRLKQGKTAAEIVYNQADHTKENMGLTIWMT